VCRDRVATPAAPGQHIRIEEHHESPPDPISAIALPPSRRRPGSPDPEDRLGDRPPADRLYRSRSALIGGGDWRQAARPGRGKRAFSTTGRMSLRQPSTSPARWSRAGTSSTRRSPNGSRCPVERRGPGSRVASEGHSIAVEG